MMGRTKTLVAIVGVLLFSIPAAAQQAPAAQPAPPKFVTPLKGEAAVELLEPQAKSEGNFVVTRIKVKNVSKGPIVGFKVEEYWYNAKGEPVSGAPPFRATKPLMPGETIDVLLKSPRTPDMARVNRVFAHQNGTVKPKKVAKFSS